MRILVFIPALDEEESIAAVIHGVRAAVPEADVLLVSDGSVDGTEEISRASGALVAALPFNQGLGAALQTGYLYALRHGYDVCAHLDADGQHMPADLARLIELVRTDQCDLAIGSRYQLPASVPVDADTYRPTVSRRIGTLLFRQLLSFTTRHRFTDTTSGFRAANRRAIALFAASYAPDFHELESLQRAVRQRLRIQELPVKMLARSGVIFVFKGLIVVAVGSFRGPQIERPAAAWEQPGTDDGAA